MKVTYGYNVQPVDDPLIASIGEIIHLGGNVNPGKFWVDSIPLRKLLGYKVSDRPESEASMCSSLCSVVDAWN